MIINSIPTHFALAVALALAGYLVALTHFRSVPDYARFARTRK